MFIFYIKATILYRNKKEKSERKKLSGLNGIEIGKNENFNK